MDYIVLRFSNVYGMYDESDRFIPLMIREMKANKDVAIFGKNKLLDFTYIDDCINGVINSVENFFKVKNNVFNVASGEGSNLVDVADIIKKNLKSESHILVGDNRQGEVVKYIADISKAREMLGYKPKISLEKGIELSIDWYKNIL